MARDAHGGHQGLLKQYPQHLYYAGSTPARAIRVPVGIRSYNISLTGGIFLPANSRNRKK